MGPNVPHRYGFVLVRTMREPELAYTTKHGGTHALTYSFGASKHARCVALTWYGRVVYGNIGELGGVWKNDAV